MDKIIIKGLQLFAYHGVNKEEKENGQTFVLDLVCHANLTKACASDDLAQTVNYAKVVKCVRKAFTQEKYDLIERAAQVVCDAVLETFDAVQQVDILLKKPEAPVSAEFEYMAVALTRTR